MSRHRPPPCPHSALRPASSTGAWPRAHVRARPFPAGVCAWRWSPCPQRCHGRCGPRRRMLRGVAGEGRCPAPWHWPVSAHTGSHGRGRGQWSVCWSPRLFKATLGRGALLTLLWGHREPPRPVVGTAVQRPSLPSVLGPLRPGYTWTVPPSSCRGRSHTAGPAARDF